MPKTKKTQEQDSDNEEEVKEVIEESGDESEASGDESGAEDSDSGSDSGSDDEAPKKKKKSSKKKGGPRKPNIPMFAADHAEMSAKVLKKIDRITEKVRPSGGKPDVSNLPNRKDFAEIKAIVKKLVKPYKTCRTAWQKTADKKAKAASRPKTNRNSGFLTPVVLKTDLWNFLKEHFNTAEFTAVSTKYPILSRSLNTTMLARYVKMKGLKSTKPDEKKYIRPDKALLDLFSEDFDKYAKAENKKDRVSRKKFTYAQIQKLLKSHVLSKDETVAWCKKNNMLNKDGNPDLPNAEVLATQAYFKELREKEEKQEKSVEEDSDDESSKKKKSSKKKSKKHDSDSEDDEPKTKHAKSKSKAKSEDVEMTDAPAAENVPATITDLAAATPAPNAKTGKLRKKKGSQDDDE